MNTSDHSAVGLKSPAMEVRRFFVWILISLVSGFGACSLCPSSDTESLLQINHIYTYRFRAEALSQAVGTTEDHGKIAIECEVHIAHESDCFYNLDLHNCVVTATGGEPGSQTAWIDRQPLPDLSRYPVAFALSKGEIVEIKAHKEDPLYYVNIKRGVLSAFVFKLSQTKTEVHESHTDIHGTCPLTSVPLNDAEGTVKTSKDMLHCNFPSRPDWQFSPWSLFWNMSFIQHVINSTTDCEYKVNVESKQIERVFCKERHAIMLESTHRTTTAVQTNVFYYLDFMKSEVQTSKPVSPILTRKTDIRFEYEHTPVPQSSPSNFLFVAKRMLSDIVLDSMDEVRLFTIPQFTDLVGWIRTSHDFRPLIDSVKDCSFLPEGVECNQRIKDAAYSYLSDALLQCNNLPCAKTLKHLIMSDNISPMYLNFIFYSWSYMHYAKPGFVTNFAEICREKNSQQCWISLGSLARRICSRNTELDDKVLEEVTEVASTFYNSIGVVCEGIQDTDKLPSDCLMFMKAASNMGKRYNKLTPEGAYQLLEVATDEESPVFVRTAALEALKVIYDETDHDEKHQIYDRLLPLLKNTTLAASIRILSYEQLLHVSDDYNFEEHLFNILKEDNNAEVKSYIARSLNSLTTDEEFKSKKFLKSLLEMLHENELSLEVIIHETKGKSRSTSRGMFVTFPFMPDNMQRFGFGLSDSFIYDSHMYPTIFNTQAILQSFSSFLPETKFGSYVEGWEELILAFTKNIAEMNGRSVSFAKIYESLREVLKKDGQSDEDSLRNYDDSILLNLKKLRQLYWENHRKLKPYANAYLDLFGSTVKYFIEDSFQSDADNQSIDKLLKIIGQKLAEGVSYNTSRVIRVIEAYHQVPTMMGLPLNWTTNATLAFSIHAGMKVQMSRENQVHAKGFLQPSAALTFLNRMVLDFPTVTQIGVQANSSAYTSTEFKGQYNIAKGKQTFKLERPSRTQKILELFRTNQLIKHNNYEDIPDWDIERTYSSWCTQENSAVRLKLCLSKSYPNVTHRIKPWALMAGWCKWQLLAEPTSGNDVHYDLELQEASNQRVKEITAKISVSESNKEKAATFKAIIEENGRDLKVDLKTSLMPDFSATFRKTELARKVFGHKIEATVKLFKDFKYELEYSDEGKIQKSSLVSSSPPDEDSRIMVNEERLKFKTPYSVYMWDKTLHSVGENTKSEMSLSYENFKGDSKWMKQILPPAFWENDEKAYLKVFLHWKKPFYTSQDTVTRQTEFRLQMPRYVMTLDGNSLSNRGREQINVNIARTDTKHGKLDAFLTFTSDFWSNENKRIQLYNITIPRRSWAVTLEDLQEGTKLHHELRLKRALMTALNDLDENYVGWWSDEVSDSFRVEEQEIKLTSDLDLLVWSNDDIANKFPSVAKEDLEDLSHSVYESNVVLSYPFSNKIETVDFDGYFIFSMGDGTSRFQKSFDMTSTYNNLKLTSHSVYQNNQEAATLYHNSYFTHLPTETKAYNTIHFLQNYVAGKCMDLEFKHDIRSDVFDLSTDATYKCESGDDGLYTLRLNMDTNSSKWDMLDLNIKQIVENVSPDYSREESTTTHALGSIHVDAEWWSPPYHHQKKVTFCGKDGNCPNAELFLEFWHRDRTVKFSKDDYEITFKNKMSSDYKKVQINVDYGQKEETASKALEFTGEILRRNFHVWKTTLYPKNFDKVKNIFATGYKKFANALAEVAKDKNHPLNDILEPALKMTLYDYWRSLKAQYREFFALSWSEFKEIAFIVDAFIEPAYIALTNSITACQDLFSRMYINLKDRSVVVWAINYFHLPHYFQQSIMYIPRGLMELWNHLASEDQAIRYTFVTGKILALTSFNEWPSIEFITEEPSSKIRGERNEKAKVGMIFGPSHVYTFDGEIYDVPNYPHSECLFLLAHDVHKSLFTVFTSEKNIHILFPEMSITINDENEVFVNGSQRPISLPLQASNGKVTVKRGHVVEVWSPSLSVICRSHDFLCVLKLSDYHSGGVMGLLGNADEDSSNEFMLPNGKTSSSFLEFVKSYEISDISECKNFEMTSAPSLTSEVKTLACNEAFGDICWNRPDIREKFLKTCISDIAAGHSACYTAAGLSALCNLKYIPSHTDCNMKKQEKDEIGRSLEVVLVVQETKYLTSPETSNLPLKGIESLITALDSKFQEEGYSNIHYSLVGYGGNGVHYLPTIHSSKKDIWMDSDTMRNHVLKTLDFKSKEEVDSIHALKYALEELGDDSFVSKVFIVITAKDRQVPDKTLMNYIHTYLEENGITLYTISSYPSIEKGKKVFGVRADGLIFPSQTEGGDAYLDYPRGSLAKLTSSTRGSVFLTKFLRDNKPSAFFTEFAQEVWSKVNKEAKMCRRCKSVRNRWWWYRSVCKIVQC